MNHKNNERQQYKKDNNNHRNIISYFHQHNINNNINYKSATNRRTTTTKTKKREKNKTNNTTRTRTKTTTISHITRLLSSCWGRAAVVEPIFSTNIEGSEKPVTKRRFRNTHFTLPSKAFERNQSPIFSIFERN